MKVRLKRGGTVLAVLPGDAYLTSGSGEKIGLTFDQKHAHLSAASGERIETSAPQDVPA